MSLLIMIVFTIFSLLANAISRTSMLYYLFVIALWGFHLFDQREIGALFMLSAGALYVVQSVRYYLKASDDGWRAFPLMPLIAWALNAVLWLAFGAMWMI